MLNPGQSQSSRFIDEIAGPPAGTESGKDPCLAGRQPAGISIDLAQASLPSASRYLDDTGKISAIEFRGWQGTWIEDA